MLSSEGRHDNHPKEAGNDRDQPDSSLPRLRQPSHRQERTQPLREPAVPRACGSSKVLSPKAHYSGERRAEVLRAYQGRSSLRGLSRTFGITRKTITAWLKKSS